MDSKSRTFFRRTAAFGNIILVLAIVMLVMTTASADVGTTFTYQGQLLDGSGAVDDTCDIQFGLYDAATDGAQVGSTVTKTNVDVEDGLFTVELDFGTGAFDGDPRWLELAVRCPAGSGVYDTLSPRQSIAPTPYAVYAAHANIASDVEPGAITPAHLNGLPGNGTSGQVLASDGSGGFAWQGASSASVTQLVQDFVMTSGESVSAGDVVSFLGGEACGPSDGWGIPSVFNAGPTNYIAASALSATDFVVAYRDDGNSDYGTAITGTVNGGTVTWGTPSVFNQYYATDFIAVSSLSATEFVVAYREDEGGLYYGRAITGTISGGTLSWGDESTFSATYTSFIAVSSLSTTEFVVVYRDGGNSSYGTAITGTVSGGSLSWGTPSVFNAAGTNYIAVSTLSATDFVVVYQDIGNSNYGTAIAGTVSGGTLSWGTESVFNAGNTTYIAVSTLSTTDFVVAYQDGGNSNYGTAIVGAVGGGTVSWGAESVFNAASTSYIAIGSLSATDFVVAYQDAGNSGHGTAIVGTASGSSSSWGGESVFVAGGMNMAVSGLSATDFVIAYLYGDGTAIVGSRIGYRPFIGTAKTAASGGETVTVIISGVSDMHTGLVPGEMYYLQADGSLGLTPTDHRIGLAISTTELILDQLW